MTLQNRKLFLVTSVLRTPILWFVLAAMYLPVPCVHSAELWGGAGAVFVVVGETQSIRPYENQSKTPNPRRVATLKITEVLNGSSDLIGQTFEVYTSDAEIYGNTRAITPALKTGEVAICAIARSEDEKKTLHMLSFGPYPVGDDLLPCVKGREVDNITERHADYDALLQRLRHRRDHPEAYKTVEGKAMADAAVSKAITPQSAIVPEQTPVKSAAVTSAAVVPERASQTHLGLWMAGIVAAIIAVFFLFRKG